jgi:hypothetical protein
LTQLIATGLEFGKLVRTLERTAFRLEMRDQYNSPLEAESQKFVAGEPDDLSYFQGWLDMVRAAAAEGRQFARVRVVGEPLTDYARCDLWTAKFTNEAGDDIRYLTRAQALAAGLPRYDYWLCDSRKLVMMHFDDEDDRFLGAEIIEDSAVIVKHNYWRDAARDHAARRDDFATE